MGIEIWNLYWESGLWTGNRDLGFGLGIRMGDLDWGLGIGIGGFGSGIWHPDYGLGMGDFVMGDFVNNKMLI